jgi:catechol 2,3-dioxygenase-like lactoylglutathione lyase family enzyme
MTSFAMAMLVCSDLARSRAFYRDVLALHVVTDAFPDWVDFELSEGQRLGLHPDSETLVVRPGSLQLGFHVENVDAFIADARTAGVRVLQDPFEQSAGRVAVIADPDGYVIQIFSPKHAGAARR